MNTQPNTRPAAGNQDMTPESFAHFISQLPDSKQQAHRWLQRLIVVFGVVVVAVFLYALYASVAWQQVGEKTVVLAWLFFLLSGAPIGLLMGLDTLMLGVVMPLPWSGQASVRHLTGRSAPAIGWGLIAVAALLAILVVIGIAAVQAGRFGLADWIRFIVTFSVSLGLLAGGIAIVRRMAQRGR